MTEPETLTVKISETESVTALLYPAAKARRAAVTMILGHGAGGNQLSGFMRLFASGLADRGLDAMTFNFSYSERGRGAPDPKAKLEACYRAVIETATRHRKIKNNRIIVGGKSMGGRISSQVAAEAQPSGRGPEAAEENTQRRLDIAGLVFLGYPLHPPGQPEKLRIEHLPSVRRPMLFVQGSRDPFGTIDEVEGVIKRLRLPATLYVIEGGDHSFKVPKSAGPQTEVYETVMDEIARWVVKSLGKSK